MLEKPRDGASLGYTKQVTVNDTADVILAAAVKGRPSTTILNMSDSDTMYIGFLNTVDDTTGFPLHPGDAYTWRNRAACFGICLSGTVNVAVIANEDL